MITDVLDSVLTHAESDPDHAAAKDDYVDLSYGQLRDRVAVLAAGLADRGIEPGARIALHLPNSVDFLVSALACMWVGATFIPLAVTDPPARVAGIVVDCDPSLILTNGDVPSPHPLAIDVAAVAREDVPPPAPIRAGDRPAYAIYTSGTTGAPKGVVIGRRAFAAAVDCIVDLLGLGPDHRGMSVSPFHFDGSFGTLFPTMAAGCSLVIPPRESLLFPRYFFKTLLRERVTVTSFSPSYLHLLLSSRDLPSLRESSLQIMALGGEACSAADVARLWSVLPNLRVFNRYGPTETTIAVSELELTPELVEGGGPVPIGSPHRGSEFFLVGEDGRLIDEPDCPGELYIGGAQLMSGYWRAPELTADVLRSDVVPGQTVYRSGDLAMCGADGNYVYLGRADRVIKRNAVRISLFEIETSLGRMPGVRSARCAVFDNDGQLGIAAFVVTAEPLGPAQLRAAAAQQLPESMLPDRFEVVEAMPLAPSSKVDERKLLADVGLHHP